MSFFFLETFLKCAANPQIGSTILVPVHVRKVVVQVVPAVANIAAQMAGKQGHVFAVYVMLILQVAGHLYFRRLGDCGCSYPSETIKIDDRDWYASYETMICRPGALRTCRECNPHAEASSQHKCEICLSMKDSSAIVTSTLMNSKYAGMTLQCIECIRPKCTGEKIARPVMSAEMKRAKTTNATRKSDP